MNANGLSCMRHFDIGEIFRFRYGRSNMSCSEALEARQKDLKMALEANTGEGVCCVQVKSHTICLRAYCMLFDINYASMKRTWRRLSNGSGGHEPLGRPRGSSGGVLSSARGMQAYAWLKTWIEISGDQDPVGHPYKYIISFVLPADLYEEYVKDFAVAQLGTTESVLSGRAFARVWTHFKSQERVRVRRKANTTTKCQGDTPRPPPPTPGPPAPPQSLFGFRYTYLALSQFVTDFARCHWTPPRLGQSVMTSKGPGLSIARKCTHFDSCMWPTHSGRRSIVPSKQLHLMAQTPTPATVLKTGGQLSGGKPKKGRTYLRRFNRSSFTARP